MTWNYDRVEKHQKIKIKKYITNQKLPRAFHSLEGSYFRYNHTQVCTFCFPDT
jgi:hypothetical protein